MTSETNPSAAKPGDEPDAGRRASRRTFLTGAGAAAAGVGAVAAGLVGASPADAAVRDETERSGEAQPIVAYVSDPATGEITLMSGEREVTVTDHRLAQAFARKVR